MLLEKQGQTRLPARSTLNQFPDQTARGPRRRGIRPTPAPSHRANQTPPSRTRSAPCPRSAPRPFGQRELTEGPRAGQRVVELLALPRRHEVGLVIGDEAGTGDERRLAVLV
jgi:hypothetical protein